MTPKQIAKIMNILVVTSVPSDLPELTASVGNDSHQFTAIDSQTAEASLATLSAFGCVLLRVSLGSDAEFQLLASFKQRWPNKPIVAYGDNWQVPGVVQAIKSGADEVCEFTRNRSELQSTLNRVLSAETNRRPPFSDIIPRDILEKLNSEEARILQLLVQGRTTKEVGATLDVSIRTIHYRKKELLRKLGVQNRSEAIEMIRIAAGDLFIGLSS